MNRRFAGAVGKRYRLEQFLGEGGMGSVYRAYDRLIGQRVALKIVALARDSAHEARDKRGPQGHDTTVALSLDAVARANDPLSDSAPPRSAHDKTMTASLQDLQPGSVNQPYIGVGRADSPENLTWARMALAREFRTLATLRHPHIISVLDYGFIDRNQPFFTMELLEQAQSLSAACKGLATAPKAMLLVQLLRALSYLHRHGVIHRDLKPANVMVVQGSQGPVVKLLDFGLAHTQSHHQARPQNIWGTLSYMAPELFLGQPISAAADLFSIGVIAYELFTGQHPFEHEDEQQLILSILKKDPDCEPLLPYPQLTALLRQLLSKSPSARLSADEALTALGESLGLPLTQETVALRESALQAARLVGREEPMAELRAALEAARAGFGAVRLLAGESGVGKSRLMEELRVYSLVQGVLSIRGQAVSEGRLVYGVWHDILRTLCLSSELEELDLSVLKSILPDLEALLERAIPDAVALNPQAAQLRLLNVAESLILRQTEPLILLLEDLHWADAESLALVRRLVSSCRARPMLIVASYRDDESPNLPRDILGCQVVKLTRLSGANVAELCQSMLGAQGCTPELVSFLEAETEGNVFFVIEVMRALAEEAGQLSRVSYYHLPKHVLTGGIQAIVQRRLARLPAAALPLLQRAAVAGRHLDLAVLRTFEPNLDAWLYLAADAAVLEVNDHSWRFAHDKVRESLLLELGPAERKVLHLELARALESTYPRSAAHAAAIAEHYQKGECAVQAAFYLVEAGEHALSQGATEQAAALLNQALAPESRGLLPRAQAARAHNYLIQANIALGRFVESVATYEQLMARFGFPMPKSVLSMAAAGGELLVRQLRRVLPSSLVAEAERQVWTNVAQATRWASEAYVWVGQPLLSIVATLRGAELAEALGDQGLQSYFLVCYSYLAGLVPLQQVSKSFLEKGSRLLPGLTNRRMELDFRRIASARHMNAADWELAKSEHDAMIVLSRQIGDEYSLMFALSQRMIIAFRQQEESVFESLRPELSERAERNQSSQFARAYPVYQGLKTLRRGDAEGAWLWFSIAEGYVQKSQDLLGRIIVGGLIALCLFQRGEPESALLRAQDTMNLVDSTRLSNELVGEGISAIVELCLSMLEADIGLAKREFTLLLRNALSAQRRCALIFPSSAPRALLWHARYTWNLGAGRLARKLGEASHGRAKRLRMPYDEALALSWGKRFAGTPPGAAVGLTGEIRHLLQILARELA